jgi:hypothetical protein
MPDLKRSSDLAFFQIALDVLCTFMSIRKDQKHNAETVTFGIDENKRRKLTRFWCIRESMLSVVYLAKSWSNKLQLGPFGSASSIDITIFGGRWSSWRREQATRISLSSQSEVKS